MNQIEKASPAWPGGASKDVDNSNKNIPTPLKGVNRQSKIDKLKAALPSIQSMVPDLKPHAKGELAGPCPWCGGDDRFVLFKDTGRFMCRQCIPQGGDIVDYHCRVEGTDIKGLMDKYLPQTPKAKNPPGKTEYTYLNEAGEPFLYITRIDKADGSKTFSQRRANGGQVAGMVDHIPYGLPNVMKAGTIYIVEGEKCADFLIARGIPATTNSGGSGVWQPNLNHYFKDKDIVILEDNDLSGKKHTDLIIRGIKGVAKAIKVVSLPGLPPKGDIANWIEAGHATGDLEAIVQATPVWTSADENILQEIDSQDDIWPEPILFEATSTPEIPCNILPGFIGDYCQAITDSAQTPGGLAVMMALSVLGTCLQKRFIVSPYGDGYFEPLSIWTVTGLDPATRKSAVKDALISPLNIWEHERREELGPLIRQVANEIDVSAKRIELLKNQASKPGVEDLDRRAALDEIKHIEEETPDPVTVPRLWGDDITPERLQGLLCDNGERIGLLSDEAGIFEVMAGMYNGGRMNINVFLQGHAGGPVRVSRQGREVDLKHPALSFGLAIQPGILQDLGRGDKAKFRANGLLARFLYCLPKSTVGHRDVRRRKSVPESVKAAYVSGIMSLLSIEPTKDMQGQETPQELGMSPSALDCWLDFSQWVEDRQGPLGELHGIQDWSGKLPGAVLRIAGLLHVAEHGKSTLQIEKPTMDRAITLARLLIVHTQAAFDLMGHDPAMADAKVIYQWIFERRTTSFSKTDIYKEVRIFRDGKRLSAALNVLTDRYIISTPQEKKTPGRPSTSFDINPGVLCSMDTPPGIEGIKGIKAPLNRDQNQKQDPLMPLIPLIPGGSDIGTDQKERVGGDNESVI